MTAGPRCPDATPSRENHRGRTMAGGVMRVQGETPEVGPNAEGYADAESEASAEVVVRPSSADVLRVRPRQRMWSATVETVRRRLPELRRGTAATVSASAVATVGTGLA